MKWTEAVEAMKHGARVRRVSESVRRLEGDIYVTGQESSKLEPAITADGERVLVFMGAWSRVLFAPDETHMTADDWVVVND